MFSPNKLSNSPLTSSFEEPVYQHQQKAKNMENDYFNKQYQKSLQTKQQKQQYERQLKRQELQLYNMKKQEYLSEVANSRFHRYQQQQYMADQYEEMIRQRKLKEENEKKNEKIYERDLLGQKSWIKDVDTQRQLYKKKNKSYSSELQEHVHLQEMRKQHEKQLQKRMRDKINEEAQQILEKQYLELQQRSKQRKSMFEMRQNQLLGISESADIDRSANLQNSGVSVTQDGKVEQISLRKKEQEIYGKGLDHQRQLYEQYKKKQMQQPKYTPHQSYNPITNPLPLVYKNPNVLRMLSQR